MIVAGLAQVIVDGDDIDEHRFENGPLNDAEVQRIREAAPGMTETCVAKLRTGGTKALQAPTAECFQMTASQRWSGLWRNDFEGSLFCPAPAKTCGYVARGRRSEPSIWLDFGRPPSAEFSPKQHGGLYAVEFIGRRTAIPGHHGHMGVFDAEMIVDQLISMKEIEAPPRPSKADIKAMKRECLATPGCARDKEMMNALDDELKK